MASPLMLRNQNGAAAGEQGARRGLPAVRRGPVRDLADTTVRAWVFGKILNWSVEHGIVSLQVRPIAILRDYAHQH